MTSTFETILLNLEFQFILPAEMNQINVIESERSSALISHYLFIFIPQAINALNKQFNLGWKLMNCDFKGDLQTYGTKFQ